MRVSSSVAGAFDKSQVALVSSKLFVGSVVCGCGGFIVGWLLWRERGVEGQRKMFKNMVAVVGIELREGLTGKEHLGSYKKWNRCIGGPNDVSLLCGWPDIWVVGD